jgi:predicted PurR-regulated permease PerM
MQLSEISRRYLLYGLSVPVIVLNLWVIQRVYEYFQDTVTFVILAAILALILNYLVTFLERFRLNRTQAVLVVLISVLVAIVILGFTIIPVIYDQSTQLFQRLPELLTQANQNLDGLQKLVNEGKLPLDLSQINNQLFTQAQNIVSFLPGFAVNTAGQLASSIFLIVLSFYMLLYGDRCWQGIVNFFPRKFGQAFSVSLQQQFHQFFLSQFLLALVMVLFLTPTFLIMGIRFGLLFAIAVGIFEIIPLFGATIGIGLITLLAWGLQDPIAAVKVIVAGIIFQQIIDNVIAPRVRGNFSGLNPIWIIISLFIGWRVAGFVGVILAMPIGGTIKSTVETLREMEAARRQPKLEDAA